MTPLPNLPEPVPPPADDLYAGVPGVLDDLDAHIAAVQAGSTERADWHIDNPQVAAWAMAKLAEAKVHEAHLAEQRLAQMQLAEAWYARTSRAAQRTIAFMTTHLEDYALRQREAGAGATLVLPNGDVATRKGAEPAVVITDDAAVVAWARKSAPSIVKTTHKVNVTDLRAVAAIKGDRVILAASGEVVPGAAISPPGEPTATVKPH